MDVLVRVTPQRALRDRRDALDEDPLALDEVEKRHILQVLDACGGNKSVAARRLGIARKTLDRKLAAWQGGA